MPRVKILQACYDGRKRHREGAVVDWKLKKGDKLPAYVEELDEDERPTKGKGKGRAAPPVTDEDLEEGGDDDESPI